MAYNNKGIIIIKNPQSMGGGGSLEVLVHDPTDPKFPYTSNQKYASFSGNPPQNVGSEVLFDWTGNGPYTAKNLRSI